MKKTIDIIIIILAFFIIYFLQTNFFTWFNIAGIMPNLFVVLITMIGLFLKKDFGLFFGIVFGIFLDFFIGTRIGLYSIALGLIGLIAGILEKSFSKDSKTTVIIITAILTAVFEIIVYILNIILVKVSMINVIGFIRIVLVEVFYNGLMVMILYPIISRFGYKLEEDFINKSFLKFL